MCIRDSYNRWETDSLWHTGLFEYVDTGFVNKVSYISNPYSSNSYTFLDNVGGSKIGINVKYNPKSICIDRFSNYSFDKYFCLGDKISNEGTSETGVIVGTEIQNFLIMVVAKEPIFAPISKLGLLHWDGKTISKEIGLAPTSSPYNYSTHILFCIDNETYVVYEPYSSKNGLPCLYIGNKKK